MKKENLHVEIEGRGPAVVLIHGVAASHHEWRFLTPALIDAGFRVISIDLPGHGDSPQPDEPHAYHSRQFARLVESWIEELTLDEPAYVIGHSLGGYISLRYTLHHPRQVRGLVLISPLYTQAQLTPVLHLLHPRPSLGGKAIQIVPERLLRLAMRMDPTRTPPLPREARLQNIADLKRASPHILHLPFTIHDLTPQLPGITQRALVIWGEHDLTLQTGSFPRLVEALPNAAAFPVEQAGHQPHITYAGPVNERILAFLNHSSAGH